MKTSYPAARRSARVDNVYVTAIPLRDRLVQAGVELLEEDGLANLSLRAITRRTGVSHGAPRRYFPTHNSLLAAIAATGLADLASRLRTADVRRESPEELLVAAAERYLEFAAERPGMFDLLFRHDLLEGAGGNLRQQSLPLFQVFIDQVAQVHPNDARDRAIALWTNIHGLATLRATRALDLLATTDLTPIVRHIVHVHLT
jgi:AcrR family transcriptional regulator